MKSTSVEETCRIASNFLNTIKPQKTATIVALVGDLGSGKTTFVQCVANTLGIKEAVTSPTFVIEKIYALENSTFDKLIHIDAYRLESGSELISLGWEEIVSDPQNLIFLEWADRVEDILPSTQIQINFKFENETTRDIVVVHG